VKIDVSGHFSFYSDVVNRIRNGESIPYRPVLPETTELGRPLVDLIKSCWSENPDQRPTFVQIRAALRKITGGECVRLSYCEDKNQFFEISVFFSLT
jgi:hypothetical protein